MRGPKTLLAYYESYFPRIRTFSLILVVVLLIVGLTMDDNGIWNVV